MTTPRRLILSAIAGGLVALAAVPASASATVVASPSSLTFPQRQVGTESDPQAVTVTLICTSFQPAPPSCLTNDSFTYNPQFSGANPGDFSATNVSCPSFFMLTTQTSFPCAFNVRFKPTAPGNRQATLTVGTGTPSNPNPVTVTGSAVAAPVATPAPGKKKGCKKGKGKKKGCKKKKKK